MVFFNWATMQMAAKIVYYGPGLCGKTSNLSFIYAKTTPSSRGEMVSLETESDRTLFFDLLPIEVGTIGGFKTRLQLYTVPGQVFYNTTRKLVLKGVDGLVFVADSQRPMREANIESFTSLIDNLEDLGLDMTELPLVLQYNKRDLKNILTVDELNHDLNEDARYSTFEASAINGQGVFETLKEITKLTLKKLRKRMASTQPGQPGATGPAAEPVRPTMAPQKPESISAAALARAAEEGVESHADEHAPAPVQPAQVAAGPDQPTAVSPPMPASPGQPFVTQPPSESAQAQPQQSSSSEAAAPPPAADRPRPATGSSFGSYAATPPPETASEYIPDPDAEPTTKGEPWQEEETVVSGGIRNGETPGAQEEDTDPSLHVEFDQHASDEPFSEPPPMKRVQVSNQLDILAELEGLRAGSLSASAGPGATSQADLDIDSLISGAMSNSKEIRRKIQQALNSDIFRKMHGLELAIRIRDHRGETIHTLDPVAMQVDNAGELNKLSLRFVIDLDNLP
jgi:signal recognition particle receptor subunit beta